LSNIPVDGARIGPICLDSYDVETMFFDEALGDRRSCTVEFGRAMTE